MSATIRDAIAEISPPVMRGEVAGTINRAFGAVLDALGARVEEGVKLRFPNKDAPSSLGYIGNDRNIERGPTESHEGYAAQLRKAFDTWQNAGHPETILTQLQAYFAGQTCPPMRLVTERPYAGMGQVPGLSVTGTGPGANGGDTGGGGVDDTVAESLTGLQWLLPNTGAPTDDPQPTYASAEDSAVMGGVAGRLYDVTLTFRGFVEMPFFSGGTNDGAHWQEGGFPTPPSHPATNVYTLRISDPSQTFYLNRRPGVDVVAILNYTKTVQIRAGATVLLYAESKDGYQSPNTLGAVPGVTDPAQPYDGQFIVMRVDSVAIAAAVGNGSFSLQDGDLMGYGTYASRPAAGTAGRIWHPSDQPYESVDDGAAWRPRVDGVLCTECPSLASFTARNIGSDAWVATGGRWTVGAASRGAVQLSAYTKAPASPASFTVEAAAQYAANVSGGASVPVKNQQRGVCVRTAGGAYKTLGVMDRAIFTQTFTDANTRTAFEVWQTANANFVRIRCTGGSIYYEVSVNGLDWVTLTSEVYTPAEAGPFVMTEDAPGQFEFFHFDLT